MDFATRNLYRTAIEQMARGTDLAEPEIARRALRRRRGGARAPATATAVERDPGYHLIGGGRAAFERSLGLPPAGPRVAAALRDGRASRAMSPASP